MFVPFNFALLLFFYFDKSEKSGAANVPLIVWCAMLIAGLWCLFIL
jgi:hypothetical protein